MQGSGAAASRHLSLFLLRHLHPFPPSACRPALTTVAPLPPALQAQTVANFYLAFELDLAILPVLNKIDMDSAEPQASCRCTALYCEVIWYCSAPQMPLPGTQADMGGLDAESRAGSSDGADVQALVRMRALWPALLERSWPENLAVLCRALLCCRGWHSS